MDVKKFNTEDYAIILRPHLDEEQRWLGEVSVDIMTSDKNRLNDDDYYSLMSLASMVCASIPVMDRNPNFKKECEIESRLFLKSETEYAKERVLEVDDNVIKIDFTGREKWEKKLDFKHKNNQTINKLWIWLIVHLTIISQV